MPKKPVEPKVEFIKFIKALYTDEVALNFEDEFSIINNGDDIFDISFPDNKYYLLRGKLDMRDCSSFYNWLSQTKSSVIIDNEKLDELRKLKLGDFQALSTTTDSYEIELANGYYKLLRTKTDIDIPNIEFADSIEIPEEKFSETTITIYRNSNGLTFEPTDDIVFDSAIKNINVIFKKDAVYKLYVTNVTDGFKVVMIEGKGNKCTLNQYFKVI